MTTAVSSPAADGPAIHPLSIQQVESELPSDGDDASSTSTESYVDASSNDLTLLTGAILLTADCMGTGILALPADVQNLGVGLGIGFLLLNLPINLYAGTILSRCALYVEERMLGHVVRPMRISSDDNDIGGDEGVGESARSEASNGDDGTGTTRRSKGYSSVDEHDSARSKDAVNAKSEPQGHHHTDAGTFDFVGLTSMLFDAPILPSMADEFVAEAFDPDFSIDDDEEEMQHDDARPHRHVTFDHPFTKIVLAIYYVNLFLVLGNYILVMSHAVSAMAGENNLCIPTAGLFASTLMFGLSQLRTMAHLGRSVSAVSLLALLVVVVQCLYWLRNVDAEGENEIVEEEQEEYASYTPAEEVLAKLSSLAAIAFAVGSQKLLLNIRHEMVDRTKAAPGALSVSLSTYGLAYVVVCLLAGPEPPSFLFDAIPAGLGRKVAGFLLWIHVGVSYAINSQALCSSIDRAVGHRVKVCGLEGKHRIRWAALTALVASSSYVVANAIPFFKDLVALCGAATSIPLTLLIPAIFYRRVQGVPLCFPTLHSKSSFSLVVFASAFMVIGLVGAIGSIDTDWLNRSGPFACH